MHFDKTSSPAHVLLQFDVAPWTPVGSRIAIQFQQVVDNSIVQWLFANPVFCADITTHNFITLWHASLEPSHQPYVAGPAMNPSLQLLQLRARGAALCWKTSLTAVVDCKRVDRRNSEPEESASGRKSPELALKTSSDNCNLDNNYEILFLTICQLYESWRYS